MIEGAAISAVRSSALPSASLETAGKSGLCAGHGGPAPPARSEMPRFVIAHSSRGAQGGDLDAVGETATPPARRLALSGAASQDASPVTGPVITTEAMAAEQSGKTGDAGGKFPRHCQLPARLGIDYVQLALYLAIREAGVQVSTFEAKNRLSALLMEVARGTEVTITRRGVPVVKLVPASPGHDRERARRAAEGLRKLSQGLTLNGLSIKELLSESRS